MWPQLPLIITGFITNYFRDEVIKLMNKRLAMSVICLDMNRALITDDTVN